MYLGIYVSQLSLVRFNFAPYKCLSAWYELLKVTESFRRAHQEFFSAAVLINSGTVRPLTQTNSSPALSPDLRRESFITVNRQSLEDLNIPPHLVRIPSMCSLLAGWLASSVADHINAAATRYR